MDTRITSLVDYIYTKQVARVPKLLHRKNSRMVVLGRGIGRRKGRREEEGGMEEDCGGATRNKKLRALDTGGATEWSFGEEGG